MATRCLSGSARFVEAAENKNDESNIVELTPDEAHRDETGSGAGVYTDAAEKLQQETTSTETSAVKPDEKDSGRTADVFSVVQPAPAPRRDSFPYGVFLANIPFDIDQAALAELGSSFGSVKEAKVLKDAKGLSKGSGFIWFDTAEQMEKALAELDGSFWQGRRISCRPRINDNDEDKRHGRRRDPVYEPSKYVFVGNIPYETTDADLNRIFKSIDNLVKVRIAVDRVTGWPKGYAHCDFTDAEAATKGIKQLDGLSIGDRELRATFAKARAPRSRRDAPQKESDY